MNEERRQEELARIDGYKEPFTFGVPERGFVSHRLHGIHNGRCIPLPDYNSYDHLHRIVNEMDGETNTRYDLILTEICQRRDMPPRWSTNPTVEQMQEAILRAYGKWEEQP